MENLLKSDIFFFISSVGIVVITVGALVVVYYIVKVLRRVDKLIQDINAEAKNIIKDVEVLRKEVGSKVKFASNFLGTVASTAFLKNIFNLVSKSRKKKK